MSDDLGLRLAARRHSRIRTALYHHMEGRPDLERLERLAAAPHLKNVSDEDLGWLARLVLQPGHLHSIHREAQEFAALCRTKHARYWFDTEAVS